MDKFSNFNSRSLLFRELLAYSVIITQTIEHGPQHDFKISLPPLCTANQGLRIRRRKGQSREKFH